MEEKVSVQIAATVEEGKDYLMEAPSSLSGKHVAIRIVEVGPRVSKALVKCNGNKITIYNKLIMEVL